MLPACKKLGNVTQEHPTHEAFSFCGLVDIQPAGVELALAKSTRETSDVRAVRKSERDGDDIDYLLLAFISTTCIRTSRQLSSL